MTGCGLFCVVLELTIFGWLCPLGNRRVLPEGRGVHKQIRSITPKVPSALCDEANQ